MAPFLVGGVASCDTSAQEAQNVIRCGGDQDKEKGKGSLVRYVCVYVRSKERSERQILNIRGKEWYEVFRNSFFLGDCPGSLASEWTMVIRFILSREPGWERATELGKKERAGIPVLK